MLRVQDDERRHIARELHDSLGQYLSAIKIDVDMMALTQSESDLRLDEARQLLERAIVETRTLSHLLHPPSLDIAGFASAATWYVEGFGKRSSISTRLEAPESLEVLPDSFETALFRIMQEALTNVRRHSRSTQLDACIPVHAPPIDASTVEPPTYMYSSFIS